MKAFCIELASVPGFVASLVSIRNRSEGVMRNHKVAATATLWVKSQETQIKKPS